MSFALDTGAFFRGMGSILSLRPTHHDYVDPNSNGFRDDLMALRGDSRRIAKDMERALEKQSLMVNKRKEIDPLDLQEKTTHTIAINLQMVFVFLTLVSFVYFVAVLWSPAVQLMSMLSGLPTTAVVGWFVAGSLSLGVLVGILLSIEYGKWQKNRRGAHGN
jgi:hypothetical protein